MTPAPSPLQLVCTDFDGTIHSEFTSPPVPDAFQDLIADLQRRGVRWVINTGRDLHDLLHTMRRAGFRVAPDYLVVVEREIYLREGDRFVPHRVWNDRCTSTHLDLFSQVRPELEALFAWVNGRYEAEVFADAWSPFCLVAEDPRDASAIVDHLRVWSRRWPELAVVSNHVYARLSHVDYHKGSALREVAALCGASAETTFIAGDHFNDLPMLTREYGRWLLAPHNAVTEVRQAIHAAGGWLPEAHAGDAVVHGLRLIVGGQG
jgi:hydroxymethylpyrimidine pyrophosphatase-like HAD family hydrolase